jgi:hypothetical protein
VGNTEREGRRARWMVREEEQLLRDDAWGHIITRRPLEVRVYSVPPMENPQMASSVQRR